MSFTSLDQLLQQAVPTVAPALVCRVEQGGQLRYERSLGYINPMLKRHPVTPATRFDFASLTKLFTTTACLRMVDAGLLDLDRAVGDWLPEFTGVRHIGPTEDPLLKTPAPVPPIWQAYTTGYDLAEITLRRLLTHTSGLPAWRNLFALFDTPPERHNALHRAEILRRQQVALQAIAGFDLAYPPGAAYEYSDIGLILLGMVVTAASEERFLADALQHWITAPLRVGAHFIPTCLEIDDIAPTEFCAWRKRRLHGEVHDENAAGLGGMAGHAGLFGTAQDLTRLGNLYLEGGRDLLRPATVAAAVTPHVITAESGQPLQAGADPASAIRRGLGWMLRSGPEPSCSLAFGPRSFGHTGFTGGSLWCDPDRELVVALLTNRVYHGRDPRPIADLRVAVHRAVVEALTH